MAKSKGTKTTLKSKVEFSNRSKTDQKSRPATKVYKPSKDYTEDTTFNSDLLGFDMNGVFIKKNEDKPQKKSKEMSYKKPHYAEDIKQESKGFGIFGEKMDVIPEERENKYKQAYKKVKESVSRVKDYLFGVETLEHSSENSLNNISTHQEAKEKKIKMDQKLRSEFSEEFQKFLKDYEEEHKPRSEEHSPVKMGKREIIK